MLVCTAKPETVRERLFKRRGDASDASWSVHQLVAEQWQEASPATRRMMFAISTDGSLGLAVAKALETIEKLTVGAAA